MTTTGSTTTGTRMQYIDAMRGVAILLIIYGHISLYCYGDYRGAVSIRPLTHLIQLPMFFFISGFVTSLKPLTGGVQLKTYSNVRANC